MGESGKRFKRIAVFCGSSLGHNHEYAEMATALGKEMVHRGISLVYGGGDVGLMGVVARTVYDGLGEGSVIGVIPEALKPRELSGTSIGKIVEVKDMHTRKAEMFRHADAFVALPGGFGTLEELLEMVTWQALGYHDKPIGLLDTAHYYAPLLAFADHACKEGFIKREYKDILQSAQDPAALLDKLEAYTCPVPLTKAANPELETTPPVTT